MAYRKKESKKMKNRIFSKTADRVNVANVRRMHPRGGRCL